MKIDDENGPILEKLFNENISLSRGLAAFEHQQKSQFAENLQFLTDTASIPSEKVAENVDRNGGFLLALLHRSQGQIWT